jgi:hypothetical protein
MYVCPHCHRANPNQTAYCHFDGVALPASIHPEFAAGQVRLRTADRKWIYAHADSDALWPRVTSPQMCGPRQTPVSFEIDSSLLEPDQLHEGTLVIVANAGQRLAVRVWADVHRPWEPLIRRLRPFAGEEV